MNTIEECITTSEAETSSLGERIALLLRGGDVVLLYGELGAGKTALVRGLARGLGARADDVSSPTFTIVQEYPGGRLPLYHVDLYRLQPVEVTDLGLDELLDAGGVVAVEWPERWAERPDAAITVRLHHESPTSRRVRIERSTQNR